MNSNTYMDKQIMDLSNSHSNNINSTTDFIDFMNRSEKKEEANPSYDFMSIRPAVESSSSNEPLRSWNSFDLKTKSSPIRNYSSHDADEPEKLFLNKNLKSATAAPDASWISEIDRTMKKYTNNLMHAIDGVNARLSQLETRTGHLENMADDLKLSVGNSHGSTDGKMRHIENILREVQTTVVAIRDKQDIVDAQLKIAKLNVSVVEQVESQKTAPIDSTQQGASTYQQFPSNTPTQPPPTHLAPNAPPQHNFPPQVQLPNQFPQNQVPSVPQQEPYFPPPGPTPENPSQQYQAPPPQHQLQQHHQYHSAPQQPYSQPPPPQQPHSFSTVNPQLPHHPEETPYPPPQTYPPSMQHSPPHPSTIPPPPSQQYYGPTPGMHEPPPSRHGQGYSGPYGPSSDHVEPLPYPYTNSPSQYGSGSPLKRQQQSSPFTGQGGGSGYPQLPTARILPQALPTASAVGGSSSGSGGSGNKVSVDDVVDKVTLMGFSRDQVRATVRKLTENGQSVDLNIVLDKLMNDGDGQAPRGWHSR